MIPVSMASRTSTSTKCSSPMIRIVVVPAARSRRRLRVAASACGSGPRQSWPSWSPWPGTIEAWLWQSMRPGITNRSRRSSISVPGATARLPAGPTLVMRSSVTTTSGSREPPPSGPVDADVVLAPSVLRRDVAVTDVVTDRVGVALGGRPPAAATAAHDANGLAGGDRMLRRFAHVADRAVGRRDLDAVHGAVAASAETPRRRRFALEAEGDERRREELVHALDAEASPELAGAAGVRPQAVAQDAHRRHARFHDLHGIVARGGAPEDDHRRLAVVGRTGTRAARVEIALDEQPARLRMG